VTKNISKLTGLRIRHLLVFVLVLLLSLYSKIVLDMHVLLIRFITDPIIWKMSFGRFSFCYCLAYRQIFCLADTLGKLKTRAVLEFWGLHSQAIL